MPRVPFTIDWDHIRVVESQDGYTATLLLLDYWRNIGKLFHASDLRERLDGMATSINADLPRANDIKEGWKNLNDRLFVQRETQLAKAVSPAAFGTARFGISTERPPTTVIHLSKFAHSEFGFAWQAWSSLVDPDAPRVEPQSTVLLVEGFTDYALITTADSRGSSPSWCKHISVHSCGGARRFDKKFRRTLPHAENLGVRRIGLLFDGDVDGESVVDAFRRWSTGNWPDDPTRAYGSAWGQGADLEDLVPKHLPQHPGERPEGEGDKSKDPKFQDWKTKVFECAIDAVRKGLWDRKEIRAKVNEVRVKLGLREE